MEYVRTCPTCQLVKSQRIKPAGLLQTLRVPSRPWDIVSMDFIVDLPMSYQCDTIMVVVDYFSKQAHFIAANPLVTAVQCAKMYLSKVFKYHGLPTAIVSDRDARVLSDVWTKLFKIMGTQLRFSCAYHPQIDESIRGLRITFVAMYKQIRKIGGCIRTWGLSICAREEVESEWPYCCCIHECKCDQKC